MRRLGVIPGGVSGTPMIVPNLNAAPGVGSETFGGGAADGATPVLSPGIGGGSGNDGPRIYERISTFASGLLSKLPLRRADAPPPYAGPAGFDPNELPSSPSTTATETSAAASSMTSTNQGAAAIPTVSRNPTYANIGGPMEAGKGFENPLAGQTTDF